jgi:Tfp pilus assembly protein PilX
MLAVPEMRSTDTLPRSTRNPRENELGFSYAYASLRTERLVMARFVIVVARTISSIAFSIIVEVSIIARSPAFTI